MDLYRTTSIRITMFDSEQYILRSFNDRVQVLRMLKGLKILSDRRSLGVSQGRPQPPHLQSLPNLTITGSQRENDALQSRAQEHHASRPSSEGSSMSTLLSSSSSRRRLSMSSDQQREPLISNRRRAASDSCATPATLAMRPAVGVQPFDLGDSEIDNDGFGGVDDVSVDEVLLRSTVGDAWCKERDRILSASDFNVGIDVSSERLDLLKVFLLSLTVHSPSASSFLSHWKGSMNFFWQMVLRFLSIGFRKPALGIVILSSPAGMSTQTNRC